MLGRDWHRNLNSNKFPFLRFDTAWLKMNVISAQELKNILMRKHYLNQKYMQSKDFSHFSPILEFDSVRSTIFSRDLSINLYASYYKIEIDVSKK